MKYFRCLIVRTIPEILARETTRGPNFYRGFFIHRYEKLSSFLAKHMRQDFLKRIMSTKMSGILNTKLIEISHFLVNITSKLMCLSTETTACLRIQSTFVNICKTNVPCKNGGYAQTHDASKVFQIIPIVWKICVYMAM